MSKSNIEKLQDINKWAKNDFENKFAAADKDSFDTDVKDLIKIIEKTGSSSAKNDFIGITPSHKDFVDVIDWIRAQPSISKEDKDVAGKIINRLVVAAKRVIGNQHITGKGIGRG